MRHLSRLKTFLKGILPYPVVVGLNALRGVTYSEDRDTINRRTAFYGQFLKKDDLVFDIGANYGNHIQSFLELSCRVVAVEPLPDCARYLRYKFGNRVQIEQAGVGSVHGTAELRIGDANVVSTLSGDFIDRTIASGRFGKTQWSERINVKVITLDELTARYGVPQFAKIDTEGYEIEVIKGLSGRIPSMLFEYTLPEFKKELLEILQRLRVKGKISINWSIGESMTFVMPQDITFEAWQTMLENNPAAFGVWGDIYVRYAEHEMAGR
jgi:FkbM family methyltransferase